MENLKHLIDLAHRVVPKITCEEFALDQEQLDEVFENQEQIAVSKFYESLPKPWAIAMQELLNDEIYVRDTKEDTDEESIETKDSE